MRFVRFVLILFSHLIVENRKKTGSTLVCFSLFFFFYFLLSIENSIDSIRIYINRTFLELHMNNRRRKNRTT